MRSLVLAFALIVALPRPGSTQTADFLFGEPHAAIGVRTGWMQARAGSDLFTFVENQLTVSKKDFNAPAIGLDIDINVTPRTTAIVGFDFSRSNADSEYRNYVDNNRLPIKQNTKLRELNLSGSVKFALTPRGRSISPHAWIPSAMTPYVGVGGGLIKYDFTQQGDFVDFLDGSVFTHTYRSSGWAPSAQVFGGVDVKAWRRVYFNAEARYLWSTGTLNGDFSGFNPGVRSKIDLAGFRTTAGVRFMF
jgi:hypothetical protein